MAHPLLIAAACLATNLSCATVPAEDGLPPRRAEPRRPPVTACTGLAPGYVWSPALDSCIRVGGTVRVDGAVNLGN